MSVIGIITRMNHMNHIALAKAIAFAQDRTRKATQGDIAFATRMRILRDGTEQQFPFETFWV